MNIILTDTQRRNLHVSYANNRFEAWTEDGWMVFDAAAPAELKAKMAERDISGATFTFAARKKYQQPCRRPAVVAAAAV